MGTIWRVILAQPTDSNDKEQPLTLHGKYLDLAQRYQIWHPEAKEPFQAIATTPTHTLYQCQVIDCQPLQKSALQVLVSQTLDLLSDTEEDEPTVLWEQMGIPSLAFPYIILEDLAPMLPEVYDGWKEESTEVILLPDRSHWQLLPDLLINQSLLNLQIVYWLNQIVTLWKSLSTFNCCQSLLVEENLRIDEDQTFGLGHLYADIPSSPPSLQKLAQLWQKWLDKGGYNSSSKLGTLIQKVVAGQLNNVAELRLQLQDLAVEQPMSEEGTQPTETNFPTSSLEFAPKELPEFQPEFFSSNLEDIPTATDLSHDDGTGVLPMELVNLSSLGATDTGRQRHHNEDYFGLKTEVKIRQSNQGRVFEGRGLYIVCDGMGGHAAGEVASKMAVETLQNFFAEHWQQELPDQETILQGILLANKKLYDVNQTNASSGSGRMGTTLVLILVDNTKVAVAHVGDSRVYRVTRKGGVEQLTIDHEVGQRAIQNGVNPKLAYATPDAYQLTQALGPHDNNYLQPDIRFLDIIEDSLFLLCSDGLSDNDLVENHWESYLLPLLSSSQSLENGLNKLMEFGNSYNGHDNITAILVRVKTQT